MLRNYRNTASDIMFSDMIKNPSKIPFMFTYDGKEYNGFGEDFTEKYKKIEKNGDVEKVILTFDFKNTLDFNVTLILYYSHGTTDWTARIKNTSEGKCGIIEKLGTKIVFACETPILISLVVRIRQNTTDFAEWQTSSTAQYFQPQRFQNEKKSRGYWW